MLFYVLLFFAGSVGGFFSGLLGIGGGIIMFPLLFYIPPVLGFEAIGVKNITGLTMIQGFFASLSSVILYSREKLVNRNLALTMGFSLFFSSLLGSLVSGFISDRYLLFIFGLLAFVASVLMFIPRSYQKDDVTEDRVIFHKPTALVIGIFTGFLLGMVGQGGAFIVIPILLYILKVPLRVTLGSTLAIGLFSATAGLIGKAATGQVPLYMSLALLSGAVPAARLGSMVGRKTGTQLLRWLLAIIISATAVKVWYDLF